MASEPGAEAWDYIVVGSGAGGGTVAARLAEAGYRVLLLEAGCDPKTTEAARLPDDYDVPAFHPFASENEAISWDFYVEHYCRPDQQARDPKRQASGIFYPRAGALGGCTAHNAMILIAPHLEDWRNIQTMTGDKSWSPRRMRRYFQRMENCGYRPVSRFFARFGLDFTGHGWSGWLRTERAMPKQAIWDPELFKLVLDSAHAALHHAPTALGAIWRFLVGQADPNDHGQIQGRAAKVWFTPLTTARHRRVGARERVIEVAGRRPDRLRIELDALVTRVLLDAQNRAIGVEYLKGRRLYRASRNPSAEPGVRREVHARREVILAGGAFNTPQLLMLSGIGPRAELEAVSVPVRVDLPGVGQNLQDRYEVGVVARLRADWTVLKGAKFERGDPLYNEWSSAAEGMYVSNGAAVAVTRRSSTKRRRADLFMMGLLVKFYGYFPGYSQVIAANHNYLTWAVLKAHTNNRAGVVRLRSNDPRDPPLVNFRYFEAGTPDGGEDLRAVVEGVRFARRMIAPLQRRGVIDGEEIPGEAVASDQEIEAYVRDNAWGHHASCSCAIGPRAEGGVLDSAFRVYGTTGLRVVDASVFPRIPGFFLASAVYMIGEKAADVIIHDARTAAAPPA